MTRKGKLVKILERFKILKVIDKFYASTLKRFLIVI